MNQSVGQPADDPSGAVDDLAPADPTRPTGDVSEPRPEVIVAEQHMDEALIQAIRDACAKAGAEYHAWTGGGRVDGLVGRAALALGPLAPGSRQIPTELASLVTDQIPGLPLLLIAQEALVRPVVSLHDGLVTLVDPAPSTARLANCMRALLADGPPPMIPRGTWWPAVGLASGAMPLSRREVRVGSSFIGVLEGPRAPGEAEAAPTVWLRTIAGVSAVITASRDEPAPETGDLGGAAAFLQLEANDSRLDWFFLAPQGGAALALFSTQRFPPFTDLGRLRAEGGVGSRRLAAAPGDIAVAIAPFDALGAIATLGVDPDQGGAAILDRLEDRLRRASVACSCLVIEVR